MQVPDQAIHSYSASIEVAATPEHVYDMVADVTRMGEWSPENVGADWLRDGAGNRGDWFAGHNTSGEREWTRECEVAAAERGQDFTFAVMGVDANCTWWSYEMAPSEVGTTLTERWWMVNKTPAMAAADPEAYAARIAMTGPMIDQTLAGIKKAAEVEGV